MDLALGPLPVFDREGIKRQVSHAEFPGGLDDIADRLGPGAMALDADHVLGFGPPSVAIHDDGHVLGNFPKFKGLRGAHGFERSDDLSSPKISNDKHCGYDRNSPPRKTVTVIVVIGL